MCAILISKALRLARVKEGSHSFTCHPCLSTSCQRNCVERSKTKVALLVLTTLRGQIGISKN